MELDPFSLWKISERSAFELVHSNTTTLSAAAKRRSPPPSMNGGARFEVTHSPSKVRQSKRLNVCRLHQQRHRYPRPRSWKHYACSMCYRFYPRDLRRGGRSDDLGKVKCLDDESLWGIPQSPASSRTFL